LPNAQYGVRDEKDQSGRLLCGNLANLRIKSHGFASSPHGEFAFFIREEANLFG
jgi:hypothetical protein